MTAVPGFDKTASAKVLADYDRGKNVPVLVMAHHLGGALHHIDVLASLADRYTDGYWPSVKTYDPPVGVWRSEADPNDAPAMTPGQIAWLYEWGVERGDIDP